MNNNTLTIENREKLYVNNAVSVESLSEDKIVIYTENGDLLIKGKGLTASDFDASDGCFTVSGRIDSVDFTSEGKHYPDNFLSRLFK